MKLSIITTASLALAGSVGAANFCTQGLNYCANTLRYLDYEFYDPKLRAAGAVSVLTEWLFHCNGGGQISLVERCQPAYGCSNGGVGQNDHCTTCVPGPFSPPCREGREGQEDQEDQEGQEE